MLTPFCRAELESLLILSEKACQFRPDIVLKVAIVLHAMQSVYFAFLCAFASLVSLTIKKSKIPSRVFCSVTALVSSGYVNQCLIALMPDRVKADPYSLPWVYYLGLLAVIPFYLSGILELFRLTPKERWSVKRSHVLILSVILLVYAALRYMLIRLSGRTPALDFSVVFVAFLAASNEEFIFRYFLDHQISFLKGFDVKARRNVSISLIFSALHLLNKYGVIQIAGIFLISLGLFKIRRAMRWPIFPILAHFILINVSLVFF